MQDASKGLMRLRVAIWLRCAVEQNPRARGGSRDGASPRSGTVRALANKGVKFVITTGTNSRRLPLIREAMFAARNGLGPQQALDAITIEPAKLLGVDDRIGSLAPGKDADLVIWSQDPLDPAAVAESVYIDGKSVSQIR